MLVLLGNGPVGSHVYPDGRDGGARCQSQEHISCPPRRCPGSEARAPFWLLRARCPRMKTYSSRTSQKMRISSSLLPSSTHEPQLPRPGRHRYRALRRTPDAQRELTGRAIAQSLRGRPAVISFVTVAELGYGARLAGCGPERLRRLEYAITQIGRASCRER